MGDKLADVINVTITVAQTPNQTLRQKKKKGVCGGELRHWFH